MTSRVQTSIAVVHDYADAAPNPAVLRDRPLPCTDPPPTCSPSPCPGGSVGEERHSTQEQWDLGPDGVWRVVVATDGSGICPTDPRLRRCGYGAYYSEDHPRNHGAPLLGPGPAETPALCTRRQLGCGLGAVAVLVMWAWAVLGAVQRPGKKQKL